MRIARSLRLDLPAGERVYRRPKREEPDVPTVDTEEPLAVDVVDAIHTGDVPRLKRLLAEHPGLAAVRLGDDDPDGMNRSLLHVATDWPGHFPNVAATIEVLVAGGAHLDPPFHGPP